MSKILVTGSSGLIGAEVSAYFCSKGWEVFGVDNNQRKWLFGEKGDTLSVRSKLISQCSGYSHFDLDIRDFQAMDDLIARIRPDVTVHAAAQPSHDKAAGIPLEDFEINARGTLNLLEACRQHVPDRPFIHLSTNKVYGDAPNRIAMEELETRYDYKDSKFLDGIDENFPIDQSKHSLFGASKLSADVYVQEYGRYFDMPTVCLRGGCLTGPNHTGVELHGFLSYLVKCNLERRQYTVFGYKGKQVRDNIHSLDVARFIEQFIQHPKTGAVYNIGGGKKNSCSILEAFTMIEAITGKEMIWEYSDQNRAGDHICYYTNLAKIKTEYPSWDVTIGLQETLAQIVDSWNDRLH